MIGKYMLPREPENTGRANAKGRTIWRGPRGGEYVLVDGRRLRPATGRQPRTVPAAAPTGQRDANGRHVLQGPRGGLFVVDDAGNRRRPAAGPVNPARLMNLPDDVLRHIARQDPRAAVKLAATGREGLRVAGPTARAATEAWRATLVEPFASTIDDIARSGALRQRTLDDSQRALESVGFARQGLNPGPTSLVMTKEHPRTMIRMKEDDGDGHPIISVSVSDGLRGTMVSIGGSYPRLGTVGPASIKVFAFGPIGRQLKRHVMDALRAYAQSAARRLLPARFPWQ